MLFCLDFVAGSCKTAIVNSPVTSVQGFFLFWSLPPSLQETPYLVSGRQNSLFWMIIYSIQPAQFGADSSSASTGSCTVMGRIIHRTQSAPYTSRYSSERYEMRRQGRVRSLSSFSIARNSGKDLGSFSGGHPRKEKRDGLHTHSTAPAQLAPKLICDTLDGNFQIEQTEQCRNKMAYCVRSSYKISLFISGYCKSIITNR